MELIRELNIQIDNLCQFLPQDRVVSFAQLSKFDLLRETEKAVGSDIMVSQHDKLIELKKSEKELELVRSFILLDVFIVSQLDMLMDCIEDERSSRIVGRFKESSEINRARCSAISRTREVGQAGTSSNQSFIIYSSYVLSNMFV